MDTVRMLTSRTTKLSPSLPHRTTLSSCGFSNILARTLEQAQQRRDDNHSLVEFADLRGELALDCDQPMLYLQQPTYKVARVVRACGGSVHGAGFSGV